MPQWQSETALHFGVTSRPPNGLAVHLRGQGPRAEADAAHGMHPCAWRDAGRAPP